MFCFIYKWMISRAMDSGQEPYRAVKRHITHCGNCREFARVSDSLASSLARDATGFLQKNLDKFDSLNMRIMTAIDLKSPPRIKPRFNFRLLPTLATSVLILVITITIGLQFIPSTDPKPGEVSSTTLNQPGTEIVNNSLKIIEKVESPIESELNSLKDSINSAADFLVSCMDIKIGTQ